MQIVPFTELSKTFKSAVMLGEGGFGVVWEVNWKGKCIAVKKLLMTKKNAVAGDFIREVRLQLNIICTSNNVIKI